MPNFLMDLEDNRHSLIACKKYFDGVPTLPLGAMDGGLNSDKLLRLIVEDLFSGKVWIGQQAVEKGLADGVSTIPRFIEVKCLNY